MPENVVMRKCTCGSDKTVKLGERCPACGYTLVRVEDDIGYWEGPPKAVVAEPTEGT